MSRGNESDAPFSLGLGVLLGLGALVIFGIVALIGVINIGKEIVTSWFLLLFQVIAIIGEILIGTVAILAAGFAASWLYSQLKARNPLKKPDVSWLIPTLVVMGTAVSTIADRSLSRNPVLTAITAVLLLAVFTLGSFIVEHHEKPLKYIGYALYAVFLVAIPIGAVLSFGLNQTFSLLANLDFGTWVVLALTAARLIAYPSITHKAAKTSVK